MAHKKNVRTLLDVLSAISTLYQMEEITPEQKAQYIALAQSQEYDALYAACANLPQSPCTERLKEVIALRGE